MLWRSWPLVHYRDENVQYKAHGANGKARGESVWILVGELKIICFTPTKVFIWLVEAKNSLDLKSCVMTSPVLYHQKLAFRVWKKKVYEGYKNESCFNDFRN